MAYQEGSEIAITDLPESYQGPIIEANSPNWPSDDFKQVLRDEAGEVVGFTAVGTVLVPGFGQTDEYMAQVNGPESRDPVTGRGLSPRSRLRVARQERMGSRPTGDKNCALSKIVSQRYLLDPRVIEDLPPLLQAEVASHFVDLATSAIAAAEVRFIKDENRPLSGPLSDANGLVIYRRGTMPSAYIEYPDYTFKNGALVGVSGGSEQYFGPGTDGAIGLAEAAYGAWVEAHTSRDTMTHLRALARPILGTS